MITTRGALRVAGRAEVAPVRGAVRGPRAEAAGATVLPKPCGARACGELPPAVHGGRPCRSRERACRARVLSIAVDAGRDAPAIALVCPCRVRLDTDTRSMPSEQELEHPMSVMGRVGASSLLRYELSPLVCRELTLFGVILAKIVNLLTHVRQRQHFVHEKDDHRSDVNSL